MTSPDVNEFMRQLDQDPELLEQVRARILTRELLRLPETVAQLSEKVARQAETVDQLTRRLDQLTERVDQLTERVDQLTRRLDQLTERVDQLTERVDQLTRRLDQLTERVDQLTETVAQLVASQQETNRRLDSLTVSVQRIEGTLGNLTGTAYENRAARLMPRLLARYLRLRHTQVLQAPNANTLAHLDDMVNGGVIDGTISDQQAQELERADIIVTTRDNEEQDIYVVIEASITVDDTDINRAHERALIIGRLTSIAARAAVVGQDISPANRQRAEGLGVTFMPLSQQ